MSTKEKKIPHAKLKGLRAEKGMGMTDLAKIVGISQGSYLAKENGTTDWKSSEMIIIAKYFKESLDVLFMPE